MQLYEDNSDSPFVIQAYEPGELKLNNKIYTGNILIGLSELIDNWSVEDITSLSEQSFESIIADKPEVFLLGSGAKQIFPEPSIVQFFMKQKIAIEVMDSAAACRTYMVLTSENRKVATGIFV